MLAYMRLVVREAQKLAVLDGSLMTRSFAETHRCQLFLEDFRDKTTTPKTHPMTRLF